MDLSAQAALNAATQLVRLETELGELVAEGRVPRFIDPPKVILWGTRVFVAHERSEMIAGDPAQDVGDLAIYREAFTVAMVLDVDGQTTIA